MISFEPSILALAAMASGLAVAIDLDVNNTASIHAAARALAYGVQTYYHNNETGGADTAIGTFPPPSYWWEGGAIWGGMVDHWAYTDDSSWNEVISQALVAQSNAPEHNYMPMAYYTSLGNDDQAFWALAAMSAAEYGFPLPRGQAATFWLDLVQNVFDTQTPRWETSTCGGGLRWQIFESNKGWTYKNSISNGALFQIAARLARYTGNQTYVDWAHKSWDWMYAIGLISPTYRVFDGSDISKNCSELDHTQWSYNPAMLIYGTAMMANLTNQQVWKNRTEGLLTSIENDFFSPDQNATDIMFEAACEPFGTCNYDQLSFKAYLARWLAKSAIVYPSISANVYKYLSASALAAAKSCTGGDDGRTCGQKWYVGGYDGVFGVGQELSAMETVQSLLILRGDAARIVPNHQQNVKIQAVPETSTYPLTAPTMIPARGSSPSSTTRSKSSASRSSVTRTKTRSHTNSGDRAKLTTMTSLSLTAVTVVVAGLAFGNMFGTHG